ncbi:GNAT family N-acetyltransferase [Streptomyces longisporoflavus]|uniref:GNAT family N-acetyltransferase n=1 Tax=Streptomyces longisporoflavus TaxID=28044 RepID=A0ABW7R583_9ACTN
MSTTLRPSAADLPADYQLRTWTRGDRGDGGSHGSHGSRESRGQVTRALIKSADGAFAARGQIAGHSRADRVVFDQIETAPAHRRRGLGRVVMRTLANAAIEAGARTGVLGATVEGQGLYESLGWTTHAPPTGVFATPDTPGPPGPPAPPAPPGLRRSGPAWVRRG